MAGEDKHSRTEKPTARRKREARREGTVARTPEVVTWLAILAGSYLVQHTFEATWALVYKLWDEISGSMAHPSVATDMAIARSGAEGALSALAPALLATMVTALLVNLAQTRGLVTFGPLKPTLSRLNPKNGLKRLFSPRSIWEVSKQVVRVGLLGLVAWETVYGLLPVFRADGPLSSTAVASLVAGRALSLTREVAAISLVLAALDYIVQYRKVSRDLRMTREEVKEETKSSEGNPLVRGQIRRRQRQMARNRMIAAVAGADAVVVNPTHFAVALRYVRGQGAPKVVAKGADFLALRIREEAMTHRVPVVEDPPLARALYVACELEQEIPGQLYEAVARLLTFIYGLRATGRATRIDGAPLRPAVGLLAGGVGPAGARAAARLGAGAAAGAG
ncbi:MAG: EscU/YscU/HrcU family type III secretion system export apparatus switch protein, partial [Acidimicrobiales bacterium]